MAFSCCIEPDIDSTYNSMFNDYSNTMLPQKLSNSEHYILQRIKRQTDNCSQSMFLCTWTYVTLLSYPLQSDRPHFKGRLKAALCSVKSYLKNSI